MGEDPTAIREQIEQTRERLADTVDALGHKADVPARARKSVSDKVEAVRSKITGTSSRVSDATPDAGDVKQAATQAVGVVQENPLGLAIGAAAVGFLAGMMLPSTRVEDEQLGPVADQVKQQAMQTGQEAIEHGKQIAQETAQAAVESARDAAQEVKETARESAQQHGEQISASAQESAEKVQQTATS
jgi:ElaB/YqjD/DUF883 family membrane-anchored ribosome-binding protein